MTEQTTEERVHGLLVEHLGVDKSQIKPDAGVIDDLGGDSLDLVELEMAIEDEFDVSIVEGSLSATTDVADLIRIADEAVAKKAKRVA